jgi:diguanylate cyclase (GGDEF)-like protein
MCLWIPAELVAAWPIPFHGGLARIKKRILGRRTRIARMIELDIRTLSIVAALSTVLLAAAMLLLMSVDPSVRAIRHWALGALAMSLAFCLIALRGLIPNVLSVVIANSSLAAGYGLLLSGIGLFVGRPIRRSITPVILVCTLLAFFYFTLIAPNVSARIVIISAVLAGLSFWSAFLLLMEMPEDMRLTRGFTAAVFIAHGAYLALRAGLMFGGPPVQDFMKANWVNSLAFIDAITMSILLIVGFGTMVARRLHLRMHYLARVDLLTDLPNRRAIEEAARRETARSHRLNQPLSLVLLDVDHFKQINDQYGHQCGDKALQALAAAIARLLRPSDTFGRYGGEEFCAILPGMDERAALVLAERIRRLVEDMKIVLPGGATTRVTVSLGVAAIAPSGDFDTDWGRAFELADRALYGAKQGGRNRSVGASGEPKAASPSSAPLVSI